MTQREIAENVKKLEKENEDFILSGIFTLNKKINENNLKIGQYQLICQHEYENGKCKYCGKEKE